MRNYAICLNAFHCKKCNNSLVCLMDYGSQYAWCCHKCGVVVMNARKVFCPLRTAEMMKGHFANYIPDPVRLGKYIWVSHCIMCGAPEKA